MDFIRGDRGNIILFNHDVSNNLNSPDFVTKKCRLNPYVCTPVSDPYMKNMILHCKSKSVMEAYLFFVFA